MDFEPRASEQVPLLLKMGQLAPALNKAIDSGDTDLGKEEGERRTEKERERECVCMYVCTCVHVHAGTCVS